MRQSILLTCGILAVLLESPFALAADKKLIEFGWDEPDTQFLRDYIAEMEKTPFDGCVFHAQYTRPNGKRGDFMWECWGKQAFTEEQLQPALEELKATHFQKWTENFLRFNTAPANLDWFDDFSAILVNARLAARIAREGKCKGLLFDIEQYTFPLFKYRKQKDAATKSWDEYAAQVRKRGGEVMQAFQAEYPSLTVFLTFGYSLPWVQCGKDKAKLADADYGMLAPFLDGMVEAAADKVRFVDGHELSYGYKEPKQFTTAYRMMKQDLLPIVANPEKYKRCFSLGFGIWMDNAHRKVGWSTNDFSRNYFSPQTFVKSANAAVQIADEYVWVYTELPRWWSKEGATQNLPKDYFEALWRARSAAK
ncbi:MAG: hypothetical protein JWM16_536 [Verrucomicrobiales bacterium]|nr:hypothetical protein [Verrucomicrobiales bacterium]